jgi:N-acetylmuramoyl-L-alanine amidase
LPNSDGSWEIVKLNGRDYVTADSIQRFYRFNALKVDGKHVWMRSPVYIVKADIGSQELLINNTKFILSDNVAESKGKALFSRLDLVKLIDPVLLPNHIQTAEMFDTVVIDAGHGGHDSGAKGIYGYEKDFTLKMALSLSDALQKRGFKTVLTRRTDEFISLPGRVAISNATPRSIFISLHFNSSGPSAAGVETWALSPQGASSTFMGSRGWDNSTFSGNRRDSENIALATAVHAMVIHNLSAIADKGMMNRSMVDRGIKRARWTVLTGCNRPGILFEGGFVTNATEGRLIAAQSYREYLTNSIADAVLNYRKALYPNVAKPSIKR